jgi:uncharacterized protein YchJ
MQNLARCRAQSGQTGHRCCSRNHCCPELAGRTLTIGKVRGKPITMADGTRLIVTIHPSALSRVEDEDERHAAYQNFVADLKAAMAAHSGEAPRKKAS